LITCSTETFGLCHKFRLQTSPKEFLQDKFMQSLNTANCHPGNRFLKAFGSNSVNKLSDGCFLQEFFARIN